MVEHKLLINGGQNDIQLHHRSKNPLLVNIKWRGLIQNGSVSLFPKTLNIKFFVHRQLTRKDARSYRVHQAVDPQNLWRRNRLIRVDERSESYQDYQVECAAKLILHEFPDVFEDVPAILHAVDDKREILHQDVGGLFHYVSCLRLLGILIEGSHTHICLIQSEAVCDVLARNAYHFLLSLHNLS